METDTWLYRMYIAECLHSTSGNTSNLGGTTVSRHLQELLDEAHNPKPKVTAKEVIDNIKTKLRALGNQNG